TGRRGAKRQPDFKWHVSASWRRLDQEDVDFAGLEVPAESIVRSRRLADVVDLFGEQRVELVVESDVDRSVGRSGSALVREQQHGQLQSRALSDAAIRALALDDLHEQTRIVPQSAV